MIRVLIADDNLLTLQSMRTTIPWEEWGYEVVCWAENGAQAWEKILNTHPDIVILDIHMPGMNGLELASRIQNLPEKPLIILLSAYDKFDYAKAGLRLGVFDYLLKPLDNGELKMILDKASRRIEQDEGNRRLLLGRDCCEKLLMESAAGDSHSARLLEEHLSEQWKACGYALLLIREPEEKQQEFRELQTGFDGMFEKERISHLNVRMREGNLVLMGFQTIRIARDYDLEALYIAGKIVEKGRREGLELSVGISNYAEHLTDAENMYDEAKFALESRFFLENKSVIHYQSVMSRSVRNEYILSRKMQELYQALNHSPEEFIQCLDSFIALLEQDSRYDVDYVRTIFVQIAFYITCALNNCNTGTIPVKSMDMIQEEVQKITSMQDMVKWIRTYAEYCTDESKQETMAASSQTRKILDYLNTHYMEHLTLKDAAQAADISESHLCRLLKAETGETFVNILNKIRIQKAVRLIADGNNKVYEVAEKVGFSNYAYFYQVFKKITGTSPKEYIKQQ